MTPACYIGVDVGTGSARAGVFDASGQLLATASHPLKIWRPRPHHVEQSSADIWAAVCQATRSALALSGRSPQAVRGIGFDATCSLVVLGPEGRPLPVNDAGEADRNVIVWMDHRADAQAGRINATRHRVLDHVGGRISPEMETPKLLWLKEHQPDTYAGAAHFMDLTDFLTWKATGSLWRSTCTVACKWTYMAHEQAWDASYFRAIGLADLAEAGFARIGPEIRPPGTAIPGALQAAAAAELGLPAGVAVGMGLIDAHAGAVGTLGAQGLPGDLAQRMAYVFGTSACTLNVSAEPAFVPGVWGPYFSALVPGLWLNEGGQSAAGAAIDHLVRLHPLAPEATRQAEAAGQSLVGWIEAQAARALVDRPLAGLLDDLHVVPEFLGNRAPFADPGARAIIAGLGLEEDENSLIALYLAGICAIGYGLRQIVAALKAGGADLQTVVISGGAGRSALVRRLLADASGTAIAVCATEEPVLLGAAMTAAIADGARPDLPTAMAAMSVAEETITPDPACRALHDRRFAAYEKLQALFRELRQP